MAWIIRFYNVAHIMKTTNNKNERKIKHEINPRIIYIEFQLGI